VHAAAAGDASVTDLDARPADPGPLVYDGPVRLDDMLLAERAIELDLPDEDFASPFLSAATARLFAVFLAVAAVLVPAHRRLIAKTRWRRL